MKLMVLDGNSLVNRAFFGIKLLTTKDGRYTNAIYGFQNILLNLLAAHKPDAVAIAWDERAPTFRHNAYDGYKATRHGMSEELAQQMPVLKELLTDLGFVQVSKAGWEADDILGTLAAACEAAGGTTLLATGDRDSLQLVDDATTVLLATNKETLPMDPAAIREKYGIEPPQLIDVKSLMGDASDNIPGVPGIGEKTALALISKFGSLQGVYDNIEDKAVKPGQRAKLTANRDKADLSYMLGTIRKDAPIESDPAAYVRQPGDPAAAAQLLAMALELKANAADLADCEVQAIRLGGGSASIINGSDLDHLLRLIRSCYHVAENAPVTMRTCPADINGANMPFYNRSHFTRYDLELYSLEPLDFCTLDTLNYSEQMPYITHGFLRADRRDSMGFVLLYGKKTVSRWGFRHSVLEVTRRPVCHLLLQRCAGADMLDDAEAQAQLDEAAQLLTEAGFVQYLPRRWAKPGCEDKFWQGAANGMDVLAFGLSAYTRLDGMITTNTSDLNTYLAHSADYEQITVSTVPVQTAE